MFLNCWCCCCSFRVVKPTFLSPSTTVSAWGSSVECTPHSRRTSRDTQGCLERGLLWFFCRTASTICMAIASSFYVDLSRNRKLDDIWHVWACLYILVYNHIYIIHTYIYIWYIFTFTYIYIHIYIYPPDISRLAALLDIAWLRLARGEIIIETFKARPCLGQQAKCCLHFFNELIIGRVCFWQGSDWSK